MMGRASFILFITSLMVCNTAEAQFVSGLTNITDTSFTNASAYLAVKKKFPQAEPVRFEHSTAVRETYDLSYCRTGKRTLLIDVFDPIVKNRHLRPAVIILFGGGWRSGQRSQHYPLATALADLGYVCFTPEYRLSTEALYPAAVHDVKAAICWVRNMAKDYNIDTSRIALLGFSAGGELAAFTGATNDNAKFDSPACTPGKSRVNAVIDIDGTLSFVHPESGEGDDSKKTSAATFWLGFPKLANPALWEEASPLTHAGSTTPPVLFINSAAARMHAGRDDFIAILSANHIFTDVKTFEDSPHAFCLFHPWFNPTVKYCDDFLNKVFSQNK